MSIIIGIDLGTTNSEVAVIIDNQPEVLTISNNEKILPSVVGVSPKGEIIVGSDAKNQKAAYPESTISSVKRYMGDDKEIVLNGNQYTPEQISSLILEKLKIIAENHLQTKIEKAVITVPAYFSDSQRLATKKAGQLAGLEVVRIINEPTAAALTYSFEQNKDKKVLIYDLGGGTFDVSIVNITSDITEVLSTHGNNKLGGDDFDNAITNHLTERLKEHGIEPLTEKAKARIRQAAEIAKIKLSSAPYAKIEEEFIGEKNGKSVHLKMELKRSEYEKLISEYIEETFDIVDRTVKDANLNISNIDEIILVGGSSRTPIISEKFVEKFGITPLQNINPELCVAVGAAIQAGIISGNKIDKILVDITPYTFGTASLNHESPFMENNLFSPIIRKNTPIPTTKSEVFFTVSDGQKAVEIEVFQGESSDTRKNTKLGTFQIENLNGAKAGSPIVIQFSLDINGVLKVMAQEKSTGLSKSITIQNTLAIKNEEPENILPDIVMQANTLVYKAKKLHPLSEENQEKINLLIKNIEKEIAEKNYYNLNGYVEELAEDLYYLEDA